MSGPRDARFDPFLFGWHVLLWARLVTLDDYCRRLMDGYREGWRPEGRA